MKNESWLEVLILRKKYGNGSNKLGGKKMEKDITERILDATLEVIAREKISGTRMHLIAKEAQTSQSLLHYYYPTKNELLVALIDRMQKRFSEKRKESVDLEKYSDKENISNLFKEKKDDILNNKKFDYVQFDYWVQGTVDEVIRGKFQESFRKWRQNISEVLKNSKIDPKIKKMLPYIMVSLMMGASMQYLIDEQEFNLDEYFDAAYQLILKCFEE